MADQKVTTVRQSSEQAIELEAIARVEGIPVAEVIRTAIAEHIATKRKDPEFLKRLQLRLKEDQEILTKLSQR
jgi:hypothetical protein